MRNHSVVIQLMNDSDKRGKYEQSSSWIEVMTQQVWVIRNVQKKFFLCFEIVHEMIRPRDLFHTTESTGDEHWNQKKESR